MTLAQLLEWLEGIEAEFGNLKITHLTTLPIHQNRTEVTLRGFDHQHPITHTKTFEQRGTLPVKSEGEHP